MADFWYDTFTEALVEDLGDHLSETGVRWYPVKNFAESLEINPSTDVAEPNQFSAYYGLYVISNTSIPTSADYIVYADITLGDLTTTDELPGLTVRGVWDTVAENADRYCIIPQPSTSKVEVIRGHPIYGTYVGDISYTFTQDITFKLQVLVETNGSQVDLEISVDDVVKGTVSDTSGSRVTQIGNPGLFSSRVGSYYIDNMGALYIPIEGVFTQGLGNTIVSAPAGIIDTFFTQGTRLVQSQIAPLAGEVLITIGSGQSIAQTNTATLGASYSQEVGKGIVGLVSQDASGAFSQELRNGFSSERGLYISGAYTQGLGASISETGSPIRNGSFTTTIGLVVTPMVSPWENYIVENMDIAGSYLTGLIHAMSFSDSFNINDPVTPEAIARIFEVIEASTSISTNALLHKVIIELATLSESFNLLFPLSIVDTFTIDEQITSVLKYLELVLEVSNITDIEANILSGTNQILEGLNISDIATKFFLKLVLEAIETTAIHDPNVLFKMISSEDITVSETLENILTLSMIADEVITIDENITPNYIGNILVTDKAKFFVNFDFDDRTYSGWIMNSETHAVSNYDFNFTGSTPFDNKYLFTDTSGLYELGGSLDEADYIISSITTAGLDFDSDSDKQVPQVLLGVAGNKLILQVSIDDKHTVYYELNNTLDNLNTKQIKIGKGLIGKNWQFSLQTVDESDLTLNSIEFYPVVLKRKH